MDQVARGNINGFPPRKDTRPKRTRTFRTTMPDGRRVKKQFRDQPLIEQPLALFYQVNGKWVWHAVCDSKEVPDWATNYTQGPASLV